MKMPGAQALIHRNFPRCSLLFLALMVLGSDKACQSNMVYYDMAD